MLVDAGPLEAIPRRGARVLRVEGLAIALFRTTDDNVYALEDRCPHRGGPLSQGLVHGHCVTCPLHDWIIDLESGEATGADEGATTRFDVRVDDGRIFVAVEPRAAAAAPPQESRDGDVDEVAEEPLEPPPRTARV